MKKLINIILCLSILVATFDILDVHDIKINGNQVFHSLSATQNQDHDSIAADEYNLASTVVFNIFPSTSNSIEAAYQNLVFRFVFTDEPEYNSYTSDLYRPPIA